MNRLPMESLNNAIGVYKTTLAVCSELADEDYSPALDKATLSFLEELKEYRDYGTVEELKHYKLGDCMNDCEHYDNCSNYIYSKGYNKAIYDFAEMVCEKVESFTVKVEGIEVDILSLDYLTEFVFEIAEQLKG